MKWIGAALAMALTIAWASTFSIGTAHGQETLDPLIDPQAGGAGSRFQIVGQTGWMPGEAVRLQVGFAPADPLTFAGPFAFEQTITVLRDGTWSFPVVVNDTILGMPPGATPGYVVVRAESATRTAQNAYIYTVDGSRPAGAEAIAALGFGPVGGASGKALTLALFAAATGALVTISGAWRYGSGTGLRLEP